MRSHWIKFATPMLFRATPAVHSGFDPGMSPVFDQALQNLAGGESIDQESLLPAGVTGLNSNCPIAHTQRFRDEGTQLCVCLASIRWRPKPDFDPAVKGPNDSGRTGTRNDGDGQQALLAVGHRSVVLAVAPKPSTAGVEVASVARS